MSEKLERRLARNEDLYREVNEGILRGQWPGEPDSPIGFRCECAELGCNMLVTLTLAEYRSVREDPRRFLILSGHDVPSVERVVADHGRYVVVEKIGDAGAEAQARASND